jgi:4-hydroxy-tetrahydrodipicolinate reductase
MTFSAAFARRDERIAGIETATTLDAFFAHDLEVIVDCTVQPIAREIVERAIEAGISPVIGSTGWSGDDILALSGQCDERGISAMLVPNFSLGALLMMRFAAQAARVFPRAEIIELHHDGKRDAPSGTAALTARRIAEATSGDGPVIHSVRLPGLVAHQEVLFGGVGEMLTLRHDSLSRESFAAGILAAVRGVRNGSGLVIGLDALVDGMLA